MHAPAGQPSLVRARGEADGTAREYGCPRARRVIVDRLPTQPNGKVDRRALDALAGRG
ncbi:hypothetical protein [Rhizomonospora bruguierae]|uniref:hypothetical protein n=1 Tax=Rhizomonospora bruguierae TaxID=1581705 RepID=UPI001BD01850|nr:hypothetical protein [Micromonospora sp. NBRC 107566]